MPESTAIIAKIDIGPEDDLPKLPLVVAFEHETVEDRLRLFRVTSVRSAHCLFLTRLIQL
jgi:hypothetical protein